MNGAPLPPPSSLPFPYSAMWLAHECQTTWQNMEMDTGKFRNVQDSGRWNRYVSGRKSDFSAGKVIFTLILLNHAGSLMANKTVPGTYLPRYLFLSWMD